MSYTHNKHAFFFFLCGFYIFFSIIHYTTDLWCEKIWLWCLKVIYFWAKCCYVSKECRMISLIGQFIRKYLFLTIFYHIFTYYWVFFTFFFWKTIQSNEFGDLELLLTQKKRIETAKIEINWVFLYKKWKSLILGIFWGDYGVIFTFFFQKTTQSDEFGDLDLLLTQKKRIRTAKIKINWVFL